ncbi:MAG TPA: hypothetical protein PL041_10145 [Melioribacteraceae bacterium]|nr:hypothetical protein [Melioribacteraceae bacterium]
MSEKKANNPKTAFGKYMVYEFIPNYSNNVMGIVYMGAAILIIVVGLRGLGKVAGNLAVVPSFLIGSDGKIDPSYVMGALFLEFFLLVILATVTFFTPEDSHGHAPEAHHDTKPEAIPVSKVPQFRDEMQQLKTMADEEIRTIDNYLTKFEELSKKLQKIQLANLQAIQMMKDSIKN